MPGAICSIQNFSISLAAVRRQLPRSFWQSRPTFRRCLISEVDQLHKDGITRRKEKMILLDDFVGDSIHDDLDPFVESTFDGPLDMLSGEQTLES